MALIGPRTFGDWCETPIRTRSPTYGGDTSTNIIHTCSRVLKEEKCVVTHAHFHLFLSPSRIEIRQLSVSLRFSLPALRNEENRPPLYLQFFSGRTNRMYDMQSYCRPVLAGTILTKTTSSIRKPNSKHQNAGGHVSSSRKV